MATFGALNFHARLGVAAAFLLSVTALTACDQISNRYEITKDQTGRTLRLDKRTGEISVIEGERIVPVRSGKDVDQEKAMSTRTLATAKDFPNVALPQFGVEAQLRTSWQDGKLLYALSFRPGTPKPAADTENGEGAKQTADKPKSTKSSSTDWVRVKGYQYFLLLEDVPFQLARETLTFTEVVNDSEKTIGMDAKGSIPMSSDTYRRIDLWNVEWRRRF